MHIILLLLLRCRLHSNKIDEQKWDFGKSCAARVVVVAHHTHTTNYQAAIGTELNRRAESIAYFSNVLVFAWSEPTARIFVHIHFVHFSDAQNNGTSEWCRQAYACWLRIAIVCFSRLSSLILTINNASYVAVSVNVDNDDNVTHYKFFFVAFYVASTLLQCVCIQGIHSVRLHFDTFLPIHCATSERDQHNQGEKQTTKKKIRWKMYAFNDKRRTTNSMAIVSARIHTLRTSISILIPNEAGTKRAKMCAIGYDCVFFFYSHSDVSKQEEKKCMCRVDTGSHR